MKLTSTQQLATPARPLLTGWESAWDLRVMNPARRQVNELCPQPRIRAMIQPA